MNYTMRTASLNNMLLKNLWNDEIDWIKIKLLATALTSACPTERLEDTLTDWRPGRCHDFVNDKQKEHEQTWHLTIDQLPLLVTNVLIYMYQWLIDHLTKQLTNIQVKTYNLTYLGQYDFLMT